MQTEKTEGIVLRSQDYKERHRIITLFTPEGLLSLIVKNISRKNTRLLTLTTPFSHAEYHFHRSRSDLLNFHDGSILDSHLSLRNSLASLQTAGALANAILTSQMPGKAAPSLYALYRSYHSQVPTFPDPTALLTSFYLKLLKHEGLLTLSPHCSSCPIPAHHLSDGESFCATHRTADSHPFTPTEWSTLLALDNATQFSSLRELPLPPTLPSKITHLLHTRLSF